MVCLRCERVGYWLWDGMGGATDRVYGIPSIDLRAVEHALRCAR